jgi:hypothetical protein
MKVKRFLASLSYDMPGDRCVARVAALRASDDRAVEVVGQLGIVIEIGEAASIRHGAAELYGGDDRTVTT